MTCGCESFSAKAKTRITLQSASTVSDAYGGRGTSWVDVSDLWAIVEPMAGRELFISAQLQSRVDAKITIRWRSELADTTAGAKYRVKLGTRLYNIKAIKNLDADMKHEGSNYQLMLCVEGEAS